MFNGVKHIIEHIRVAQFMGSITNRKLPATLPSPAPLVNISKPVQSHVFTHIIPSVPITSSLKSMPPRNVQETSNYPIALFSYFTKPMAGSTTLMGLTCVSAQYITSKGCISLAIKFLDILMQWQPRSNIAPPQALFMSQNQSECGPR